MKCVSSRKLLIIYGPTATGKTDLAIKLAKKFSGELISADSRQVYKGLDIGTGKVSFDSKVEKHEECWIVDGVKIHGFDLVNPPIHKPDSQSYSKPGSEEPFSVSDFLKFASDTMIQIMKSKKLSIIVGGTGFYIKALIEGIETIGIKADWKLRHQLENFSADQLYQKLEKIDPKRAQEMNNSDRQNPRRLVRAIEIALTPEFSARHSGVATTTIESESYRSVSLRSRITNYRMVGLTAPNAYLYSRSNKWLEERLSHEMIDEIKNLLDQKVNPKWLESLGLEYRWLSRYLLGQITKEEAINCLKGDTHSFIRRQKTWFKKLPGIQLFDISNPGWQRELEKLLPPRGSQNPPPR